MSRYIDADLLIDELKDLREFWGFTFTADGVDEAIDKVEEAPTADVVEVVRCKDCKHYIAYYCTRDIKGRTNMFYMTENDYCSYGERKEKDKTE